MSPHISPLLDDSAENRKLKLSPISCASKLVIKMPHSCLLLCVQLKTALWKHQFMHNYLSCWEIVVTIAWTLKVVTQGMYVGKILGS